MIRRAAVALLAVATVALPMLTLVANDRAAAAEAGTAVTKSGAGRFAA